MGQVAGLSVKEVIEIVLASTVLLTVIGVFLERILSGRGIGLRALQLAGLGTALPLIGLFALEGILDGAVIGTLLGAIVGYLFASQDGSNKLPGKTGSSPE